MTEVFQQMLLQRSLEVAPILMREKSRRAREGGAADVAKDAYEKVPVEVSEREGIL